MMWKKKREERYDCKNELMAHKFEGYHLFNIDRFIYEETNTHHTWRFPLPPECLESDVKVTISPIPLLGISGSNLNVTYKKRDGLKLTLLSSTQNLNIPTTTEKNVTVCFRDKVLLVIVPKVNNTFTKELPIKTCK